MRAEEKQIILQMVSWVQMYDVFSCMLYLLLQQVKSVLAEPTIREILDRHTEDNSKPDFMLQNNISFSLIEQASHFV